MLKSLRHAVFVIEQRVPEELEWDEADAVSQHALAFDTEGHPIGTGRLLPDGHIGRMAIAHAWRGHGAGSAILQWLITRARQQGFREVRLHAQIHALAFYERHGFVAHGDVFDEVGIPHRHMVLSL